MKNISIKKLLIIFTLIFLVIEVIWVIAKFSHRNYKVKDSVADQLSVKWEAANPVEFEYSGLDYDSDTIEWINSTYYCYASNNTDTFGRDATKYPGLIDPSDFTSIKIMQDSLKDSYGISDREDVIEVTSKLLELNSNTKYTKILSKMMSSGKINISSEEELKLELNPKHESSDVYSVKNYYTYLGTYCAYHNISGGGVEAFDLCRAIRVLASSAAVGYISYEEYLDHALPIAIYLQSEFKDWEEVNRSYVYGYMLMVEDLNVNGFYGDPYESGFSRMLSSASLTITYPDYDTKLTNTWNARPLWDKYRGITEVLIDQDAVSILDDEFPDAEAIAIYMSADSDGIPSDDGLYGDSSDRYAYIQPNGSVIVGLSDEEKSALSDELFDKAGTYLDELQLNHPGWEIFLNLWNVNFKIRCYPEEITDADISLIRKAVDYSILDQVIDGYDDWEINLYIIDVRDISITKYLDRATFKRGIYAM